MEKWLKWAIEIQSIAQAGIEYSNNVYDTERYERLREISAEMINEKSDISLDKVNFSRDGIIHLNLLDFLLNDDF